MPSLIDERPQGGRRWLYRLLRTGDGLIAFVVIEPTGLMFNEARIYDLPWRSLGRRMFDLVFFRRTVK